MLNIFKKNRNQPFTPLLKREVNKAWINVTYDQYLPLYKAKFPFAFIGDDQLFNEFQGRIQYLIDTVVDLSTKRSEIESLWQLVFDSLLPLDEDVISADSIYFFPLLSITGEASFEQEYREKIMNKLENVMISKTTQQLEQGDDPVQVIKSLNYWLQKEMEYLAYLQVGNSYAQMGQLKIIYEQYSEQFETIKQFSAATYVDFVSVTKNAYKALQPEYKEKFTYFIQFLALQSVLVSRDAGFFDSYEQQLSEYYKIKLRKKPIANWAYWFFTGYGERPWRLVWLLLLTNFIFALLFTFLPFEFNGISKTMGVWPRIGNFLYFNHTTMLTVGYGDLFPKSPGAKSVVMLLQLMGFSISSAAVALFLRRILRF
ncbi:potassium channel family protein [Mucilaginibacter sp. E4BP6]|uniref:potassium channel family protein n=1 Tax=Mucilaginibacter sp. E4BP6 TaxID=2723089 RepID=UPI0015CB7B87|nr:potassium channel family protein [Mucilaginibacter sp. E4BP6]NYE66039.1 hypothetical protein [Mucilaginibacter sp. E4BP6]